MQERYIYVLREPDCGTVRYVGATTNLKKRLKDHLASKKNAARAEWLSKLREQGLRPTCEVVEICGENWEERERFWISRYADTILNLAPGGKTVRGIKRTLETRRKMSISQRGRSKNLSKEGRQKLRECGREASKHFWGSLSKDDKAAFIAKRSAANWDGIPSEERSKMATDRNLNAWAKRTPEERSAIGQKIAESRKKNISAERLSEIARENNRKGHEKNPDLAKKSSDRMKKFWESLTPEGRIEYLTRRTEAIRIARERKKALKQ